MVLGLYPWMKSQMRSSLNAGRGVMSKMVLRVTITLGGPSFIK